MGNLKRARLWGGIGAISSVFGLYFLGFVLKLFAVKDISEATGEEEIFKKYIWSAISGLLSGLLLSWAFYEMLNYARDYLHSHPGTGYEEAFMEAAKAYNHWFVLATVLLILAAWFMKMSYDIIARTTGVGTFKTAATLYLIGAVLLLVNLGFIIIAVGAIFEILAYFALPDELPGANNLINPVKAKDGGT